jgi:hypothetical protein
MLVWILGSSTTFDLEWNELLNKKYNDKHLIQSQRILHGMTLIDVWETLSLTKCTVCNIHRTTSAYQDTQTLDDLSVTYTLTHLKRPKDQSYIKTTSRLRPHPYHGV